MIICELVGYPVKLVGYPVKLVGYPLKVEHPLKLVEYPLKVSGMDVVLLRSGLRFHQSH